jgi:outer membrane protein assembly factor BamB
MVGACNKNGTYYALNASDLAAGPVWQDPIDEYLGGVGICIAAAVWDQASGQLFLSGSNATIDGTTYGGSVQETNPATGAVIWQTGLPAAVMGTPTLDGAGVLAVPTMPRQSGETSAVYLLAASNGQVLGAINTGNTPVFSQPVFAGNYLFVATAGGGITAYEPTPG